MPTRLQTLLDLDLPIIQAPMAGVQVSALTLAVSNSGGLGSLPCAMLSHEQIRAELAAINAGTDRPYNVNFSATGRRYTIPRVKPLRIQGVRSLEKRHCRNQEI